ncbi:MAG: FliN [Devosia sp.]|nr:FliN [Devosia sp.]
MNTLASIEVDITVELGSVFLPIHHLLRMGRGAVIELDSGESDPLKLYANGTQIANCEVRVDGGRLSVEVTSKTVREV